MESLGRKLDADVLAKLTENRITDEVLWQLDEDDLLEMGIKEKGPRKIILNYIAKYGKREPDENNSSTVNVDAVTIRSILEKETKFQTILYQFLDYEVVPDAKALLYMNRILTKHFFEHQILRENRYPKWSEKQALALKILIEFPHLGSTRVSADAPPESYFFWRRGGKSQGAHTGIIENRCSNMRKDVPPDDRMFRRPSTPKIVVPEGLDDYAGRLAALNSSPQNARTIAEGMEHCFPLHQYILTTHKDSKTVELIRTFPHLLFFRGILIQQVFERLQPNYDDSADLSKFLSAGIMLDNKGWNSVQDKFVKGMLRIFKKLTNRGVKRTAVETDMQLEEMVASPLIRWLQIDGDTDIATLDRHANRDGTEPHIVCLAELFSRGPYYIVLGGHVIPCGNSATQTVDVFLKMFEVLGIGVPVLLRKFYQLVSVTVFKTIENSRSQTVMELAKRFQEIEEVE